MARCEIPQAPNGGNSRLFSNLNSRLNDEHLLANYIYAVYATQGVAAQMDAAGYVRTKQGEHTAADVMEFLNINSMVTEQSRSLSSAAIAAGATDAQGNTIDYSDAKTALLKAQSFNNSTSARVAYVVNRGNAFNIVVENKDSRTQVQTAKVDEQLKLWNSLDAMFRHHGVDIDSIANTFSSANPLQTSDMVRYLRTLNNVPNNVLSLQDVKTLIALNPGNSMLATAISRFGDADAVATRIYGHYHGSPVPSGAQFITNLINGLKSSQFMTTTLDQIANDLATESASFRANSEPFTIQQQLDDWHQQYGIDTNYIKVGIEGVKTLSQAAATAVMTLERQIRFLKNKEGRTAQGKSIENTRNALMKELDSKHYYQGLLTFMNQALNYAQTVDTNLRNLSPSGSTMEYAARRAKVLADAKTLRDGYYMLVKSLSDLNGNIVIDENISNADIASLQQAAQNVKDILDKQSKLIKEIEKDVMLDMSVSILGEEDYNGLAIANLLEMSKRDSTMWDYLYSGSRVSNPLLATMNTVIRDAKRDRDIKMSEVALRVRRITNKLRSESNSGTGVDTSFMFYRTSRGEFKIISEEGIDWERYEKARWKARKEIEDKGLTGFALKEALEQWEETNTELKVVDASTGRQERIPNSAYRSAALADLYNNLTQPQKDYYRDMMAIKGELGSLLPNYAQDQYRPVQVRNDVLDLFHEGIKGRLGAKAIAKSIGDRLKFWKIKEDDTYFSKNGIIIDGENYGITDSDYKNAMMRQIPIFYHKTLSNQDEVLMDFSSSIQHLAGTAINYDAMSKVKDIVETMADFITSQKIQASREGRNMADAVEGENTKVIAKLFTRNNSGRTQALVDGFVSKYIYGQQTTNENEKWVAFCRGLIGYNSLKGLAMNVKGAVSNYLVGEYQMLIKAIAGTATGVDYNLKDYALAHAILFGKDGVWDKPGAIVDSILHNKNSKAELLNEKFDPTVDSFDESSRQRYHTNAFRTIFGGFNVMGLYSSGEYMIHQANMYSILLHEKVWKDGKQISLYDALEVGDKQDGNSELVTTATLDEAGTQPITEEYLSTMKDKIRHANQNCHGSMSELDKGLIHMNMAGKFVMNFRQWMVGHYSRRYRDKHWDASSREWEEGYWRTTYNFSKNLIKGMLGMQTEAAMRWENLDARSKQNVMECMAEVSMLVALLLADMAIGPVKNVGAGDDEATRWWKRFGLYQLKRLLLDAKSATPVGAVTEAKTMLNSPVPAVNTVNGFLYPIIGITNGDFMENYKQGPYKGENKYLVRTGKYTIPWWYQIEQLKRMDEDENLFMIFTTEQSFR